MGCHQLCPGVTAKGGVALFASLLGNLITFAGLVAWHLNLPAFVSLFLSAADTDEIPRRSTK